MELIKRHEGLRIRPYKDLEKEAIFYGHRLTADDPQELKAFVGRAKTATDVTSLVGWDALAESTFRRDFFTAQRAAREVVDRYETLAEARRAVLTSMAFVFGAKGFRDKWPRFLARVREEDYKGAAEEMRTGSTPGSVSQWMQQAPKRVTELSEMMASGQWPEFGGSHGISTKPGH